RLPEDTPLYISGSLFASSGVESRLEDSPLLVDRFKLRTPYPITMPVSQLDLPEKFPLLQYAVNLGLAAKRNK
ncbi:MAG: hypothetical protein ACK2TZ_11735, partial [Anaerolineales bacterium]